MPEAHEIPREFAPLQVDLPELRGYGDALDDIARDLGACSDLASSYCADADFGKIVEDLTSDYASLLPQLKEVLAENETLMREYARAIDTTASDFASTDDGVASRFKGDGIDAQTGTAAYSLSAPIGRTPSASESDLPEVSFGAFFDSLCWALEKFCGWDVRGQVTDWIAGDTVGLSTQGDCWEVVGARLDTCASNLSNAGGRVTNTWHGQASSTHTIEMIGWDTALADQSSCLKDVGASLKDLAKDAVDTAQLVVDCIRLAVDLISSAWALQYIPVYGQVKFVKKCWDAYKRASKAVAYLKMIWSAIRATKDLVIVTYNSVTLDALPGKPLSV